MLTPDQIEFRKRLLGGSDANTLMNGTQDDVFRLWEIKRGLREAPDLSDILPVRMGSFTEPLNAQWFSEQTGRTVTDRGAEHISLDHPFMGCTLDGMTTNKNGEPAIWEAKHVSAWSKPADILQRYMPQLTHNMLVTGVDNAVLSVFFGTLKYQYWDVALGHAYAEQLIGVERLFWRAVESGNLTDFWGTP